MRPPPTPRSPLAALGALGALACAVSGAVMSAWLMWGRPPRAPDLPPPPQDASLTFEARAGGAWGLVGWGRLEGGEGGLRYTRHLRLSPHRPTAHSTYALTPLDESASLLDPSAGYQARWSLEVGEQRAGGVVEVRREGDGWVVTARGEGGERVERLAGGARPVVDGVWPWLVSPCPAQPPAPPLAQPLIAPLIAPLSGAITPRGLELRCGPWEGSSPLSAPPTLSARTPEGESALTLKAAPLAERLARWEGRWGDVEWRGSEGAGVAGGASPAPLDLVAWARVPIARAVSEGGWRRARWALVELEAEGEPARWLESPRQRPDTPPQRALVRAGASPLSASPHTDPPPPPSALAPTPAYPTAAPEVHALLRHLNLPTHPTQRAQRLFEWARDALLEEERAGAPRVLETLKARRGDCNEQSALLVTLFRAAGLPAEQVFGLVALGDHAGYHAWARVWVQGAWVEVDPARGLDRVTAGHWALAAGDERAQEALRGLIGRLRARVVALE